MTSTAPFGVLLLGLLLCLAGCSTFDRDWQAAAGVRPDNESDITGRWRGTWQSDDNQHFGELRCLITRTGKNLYHAHFAATYWTTFHFEYEMDMTADRRGKWIHFEGQVDLGGMAGGIYRYDGNANDSSYYASYKSSLDHGRYDMRRPN